MCGGKVPDGYFLLSPIVGGLCLSLARNASPGLISEGIKPDSNLALTRRNFSS